MQSEGGEQKKRNIIRFESLYIQIPRYLGRISTLALALHCKQKILFCFKLKIEFTYCPIA